MKTENEVGSLNKELLIKNIRVRQFECVKLFL